MGQGSNPRRLVTLVASVALLASGCGGVARRTAGRLPEPIIQDTLRTMASDETRELFVEVLTAPEVREATSGLVAHVTDGWLDALGEPERAAALGRAIDRLMAALARAIEQQLSPALAVMTRQMMHSAASSFREDMGPALRDTLAQPETQRALGETARRIAREAGEGGGEAWRDALRRDDDSPGLAPRVDQILGEISSILKAVIAALVIGVIGVVVWSIRHHRRSAIREERARRREVVMLALLARAAHGAGGLPPHLVSALDRAVREAEQDDGVDVDVRPPPREPQPA